MTPYDPTADLERLGYTPREATFLYLVGNNSGFFLRRQYLFFLQRKLGSLAQNFVAKACRNQHISALDYGQRRHIYHLDSRTIYRILGDEDSPYRRPRGDHEITTRLLILDYMLERLKDRWLTTEAQKVEFFQKELGMDSACLPGAIRRMNGSTGTEMRYFPDRFPIALVRDGSQTDSLVRFAYFDEGACTVKAFERYLRSYRDLFISLAALELVYVSVSSRNFAGAEKLYKRTISGPEPSSNNAVLPLGADHLLRFLAAQERWDSNDARFSPEDLKFLKEGERLYLQPEHELLQTAWRRGKLAFQKELLRVGVPGSANGVFTTCLIQESYPVFGYKNAGSW